MYGSRRPVAARRLLQQMRRTPNDAYALLKNADESVLRALARIMGVSARYAYRAQMESRILRSL